MEQLIKSIQNPESFDAARPEHPTVVIADSGFFIGDYQMQITYGYCKCGCGIKTNIITKTSSKENRVKGEPSQFLSGHNGRLKKNIDMLKRLSGSGEKCPSWKGGKRLDGYGYEMFFNPSNGKVGDYDRVHVAICEKVLQKPLPKFAVIHHADGNKANNKKNNLVICENSAYHQLLHKRNRAFIATGNPNSFKCSICKIYDTENNLYISPNGRGRHRRCHAKYESERKKLQ